ncbi:MAG: Arc family DNA-binding protein [Opitutales bacterium]
MLADLSQIDDADHTPTMTIRDVPDELLARLKERAKQQRRSLNQEVLRLLLGAFSAIGNASFAGLELFGLCAFR